MAPTNSRGAAPYMVLVPRPSPEMDEAAATARDVALVAGVRSGNAGVAAAFHDRVRPTIDRTLVRLLGRRDVDHDDLAQRALIELFTTIASYRQECSLDSWAATLTARVVWKHLRRRKLERKMFEGVAPDDGMRLVAPHELASQAVMRGLVARVEKLIEKMDHDRAWAFLLHDVCGYDLREVASITSASVAAAQSRLSRGRRELHALLAADPELRDLLERGSGNRG
jgi:RNA polymerase sigma-70 factor (ECF subfamily)